MGMQTDVRSAHITGATGTLYNSRTRLRGLIFLGDGTAGDMIFRDGGATGEILLQFNIPANSNNDVSVLIPGEGILFENNIYAVLPGTASSVTIFYG
jgi:hypothetical protein